MSQLDLLNLARSCGQSMGSEFAQIIAITFALIVGIYYFLHQAGVRMKTLAFIVYTVGMFAYFGMILMDSSVAFGVQKALSAIPASARELPTQYYLGVRLSWLGITTAVLLNLVFWILWLGTSYLLFFWKKPSEAGPAYRSGAE